MNINLIGENLNLRYFLRSSPHLQTRLIDQVLTAIAMGVTSEFRRDLALHANILHQQLQEYRYSNHYVLDALKLIACTHCQPFD